MTDLYSLKMRISDGMTRRQYLYDTPHPKCIRFSFNLFLIQFITEKHLISNYYKKYKKHVKNPPLPKKSKAYTNSIQHPFPKYATFNYYVDLVESPSDLFEKPLFMKLEGSDVAATVGNGLVEGFRVSQQKLGPPICEEKVSVVGNLQAMCYLKYFDVFAQSIRMATSLKYLM